jgi:organic hydroperoxide reductase OsmC/OhrA
MLAPFPHRYTASLHRTFTARADIVAARPVLDAGSPQRAGDGDGHAGSPEHMLLSSLGLCLLSTFEVFAARDGIELLSWHAEINGAVEPTPEGPSFTSIVVELEVDIDGNTERFDEALEDARRSCLVQNALRVPVVVETEVHTPCIPAPIDDTFELPAYSTSGVRELLAC